MNRAVDHVPFGDPIRARGPESRLSVHVAIQPGTRELQCLPRVSRAHSVGVFVCPLSAQVDEETPMWCP